MEQILRCLLSYYSSEWDKVLPIAEFVYNNSDHSATGCSPFFCMFGFHPKSLPFTCEPPSDQVPAAHHRYQDLIQTHHEIKEQLLLSKQHMKLQADKHRQESPKYQVGDLVCLATKNL